MDYIHIENLKVRGKHGVTARERKIEQEFEISMRLGVVATRAAAKSERLSDALDYQPIKDAVVAIVEGYNFYLIERLAHTIADAVLKDKRIKTLELTIRKPEVWDNGVPGLTIVRKRE